MAASGFALAKLSFTTAFQVVLDNYNVRRTPEKLEWLEDALKEMLVAVQDARRAREKTKPRKKSGNEGLDVTSSSEKKRKVSECDVPHQETSADVLPSTSDVRTQESCDTFDAIDQFLRSIQNV